MESNRAVWGWVAIVAGLMLIVIVPFIFFEEIITQQINQFLAAEHDMLLVSLGIVVLLALDVFLPIPSSLVGTASGTLLGPLGGTLVTWLGLSVGCVLAYLFGQMAGRSAIRRIVGVNELHRTDHAAKKHGDWVVVLFRAVPVLAESSVIWAGASRMVLPRFLLLTGLANLGVAIIYSNIGAIATDSTSFFVAFFASLLLPGVAMGLARVWGMR